MRTSTKLKEATNDIITRADREMGAIQHEMDQSQKAYEQNLARLQLCDEQAQAREADLATKSRHLQEMNTALEQAQTFATLTQGTVQEAEAIATLKARQAAHAKAQKDLEQAQTTAQHTQAKEQDLRTSAHTAIEQYKSVQRTLQAKLSSLVAVREQAVKEHGEQLKASVLAAISTQQTRIDTHRQAVVQAQIELEHLYDEQIARLADYPELQRELQALQAESDATSRVIAAALSYVETLLNERYDLKDQLDLPVTRYQSPWWQMLTIPADELWAYQNIRFDASLLMGRRDKLRELLEQYRESQKAKRAS